jgi:hypothetical protein
MFVMFQVNGTDEGSARYLIYSLSHKALGMSKSFYCIVLSLWPKQTGSAQYNV